MAHLPLSHPQKPTSVIERVVVRFAGDSGDGMQLIGSEFSRSSAVMGNDIATFPDFPAEIRAPAGSLAGVSGFQVQFSSNTVWTPGDKADVLVVMNPAALRTNLPALPKGATIIVNNAAFSALNLKKAGYASNPLEDNSLESYKIISANMTALVNNALTGLDMSTKQMGQCKNFWSLGLLYWLYSKSSEQQVSWIRQKFAKNPQSAEANVRAFNAGYLYGENTEELSQRFSVEKAHMQPGKYRSITGNQALAIGLITAAHKSERPFFLGSYPITPASDILHFLARYKRYGAQTFQAEDEISAICAAIGASYGGGFSRCNHVGARFCAEG